MSELADGRLLYELRHRWRDGTTHVAFEPLELIDRLAALVPPPRFHTGRYRHAVRGRRRILARHRDGAGTARFPCIRAMIEADLRSWLPVMGVHLDDPTIERIPAEAEHVLADYGTEGGAVRFASSAHLVSALK